MERRRVQREQQWMREAHDARFTDQDPASRQHLLATPGQLECGICMDTVRRGRVGTTVSHHDQPYSVACGVCRTVVHHGCFMEWAQHAGRVHQGAVCVRCPGTCGQLWGDTALTQQFHPRHTAQLVRTVARMWSKGKHAEGDGGDVEDVEGVWDTYARCPSCGVRYVRINGCAHMQCTVCGTHFQDRTTLKTWVGFARRLPWHFRIVRNLDMMDVLCGVLLALGFLAMYVMLYLRGGPADSDVVRGE